MQHCYWFQYVILVWIIDKTAHIFILLDPVWCVAGQVDPESLFDLFVSDFLTLSWRQVDVMQSTFKIRKIIVQVCKSTE